MALRMLLARHDARVLGYVLRRRHPVLDRFMRRITLLGEPPVVIIVAALLLVLPLPGLGGAPATAALALILSHLFVQVLKRLIVRPRPQLPVGILSLIEPPDRFSFPSGHATASLVFALSLMPVLAIMPAILLLVAAVLVGISRCYLGVHYPGDVVVGWVIAAGSVLLISIATG
jgi:undecaprenyl-diphosphatase